ncbi:MAG: hypothetical protein ACXQTZ_05190 [Candidatus Alkanophagales archaeon]
MEEKVVPKFEEIEMKINESATVKGDLIKLISIEKERNNKNRGPE